MDIIDRRRSVRSYQNREVEPEKIEKLLRAAMQAPSAGNQQPWEFLVVQDLGAAAENLLLEAVNQGLGAVWAGIHPFAERVDAVRELFSLPPELMPFAIIAVGYPEKADANHFIDRYDPSRVHYETL